MSVGFQYNHLFHISPDVLAIRRLSLCLILVISLVSDYQADAGELTFELPDNEKMCFHEHVEKGVECVLEFQVSWMTGVIISVHENYGLDCDV